MTWWKGLIAGLLLLGVVGITVAGLKDRPPPATEVQVAKVKKGTISRVIIGAGKVEAATTVKISSNLSGDLVERPVELGDKVKKGQVLGRIDPRPFLAAAKQAQAAVSAARADVATAQVDVDRTKLELDRVQGLAKRGMSSGAEVDKSRADYDGAVARLASAQQKHAGQVAALEQAQTNVTRTTLFSPIEGTVIELSREIGERVRGSDFSEDTVMTVAALNSMEVRIEVGEHEVVHLRNGQHAELSVDALEGQSFEGSVVEIAQKATIKNPGTESEVTTFPVKVALESRPPGVLPGMSSEVRITAETHDNALIVPIQAVTVRPDKTLPDSQPPGEGGTSLAAKKRSETLAKIVFVVDGDNKARARRVRTGIASDTDLEVLDGLKEGERVVEGPFRTVSKELKDGDPLKENQPKGGPKSAEPSGTKTAVRG
ncbi:MAG TPA: efflux RND transporter periplasmic adaptor subunit [Myxococcaceae bacterium]|nr:efflux RND transporter periplasmic adaptor subunit [Myxococcaceae bacterium]